MGVEWREDDFFIKVDVELSFSFSFPQRLRTMSS